jgi:hypothetical protein
MCDKSTSSADDDDVSLDSKDDSLLIPSHAIRTTLLLYPESLCPRLATVNFLKEELEKEEQQRTHSDRILLSGKFVNPCNEVLAVAKLCAVRRVVITKNSSKS